MKQNLFNSVKMSKPGKNRFDLSHDVKLSLNMGELVPILCMEAVPGDQFKISCESLLRFAPLVAPVMHSMNVSMHYFFVPNRLLWQNWESFITNSPPQVGDNLQFPTMIVNQEDWDASPLHDYLGLPRPFDGTFAQVSALPYAAYQKVWYDYYRDQNLQNTQVTNGFGNTPTMPFLMDGNNSPVDTNMKWFDFRRRAWEHDYFTAALPFAQKGPAVDLPLGEVILNPDWNDQTSTYPRFQALTGAPVGADLGVRTNTNVVPIVTTGAGGGALPMAYDPNGSLEVGATTINDLRRAFRLQEWLEKNARGGTRYTENILAHFGVRSSDQRMQRPEYITGTKSPVVISEVVNTAGSNDIPQGNLAGHGVSVTSGNYGKYFCEEHGYIIGVMSVLPKTAYQQGIPKHFLKTVDPFQYYWPAFAHIGEQEVTNEEIYAYTPSAKQTFGYIPRYSEYKYMPSRVAGDFRDSLDFWHLGRIFDVQPQLNSQFVAADPTRRVFAVTDPDVQTLYCHVYNKIQAVRPMPIFGTPTF